MPGPVWPGFQSAHLLRWDVWRSRGPGHSSGCLRRAGPTWARPSPPERRTSWWRCSPLGLKSQKKVGDISEAEYLRSCSNKDLRALTEHPAVVQVHVSAFGASLDSIQQVVRAHQAGRTHHVQHLRQGHEGQPNCCHHLGGVGRFVMLSAPAAQGQEDLLLSGGKGVSRYRRQQRGLKTHGFPNCFTSPKNHNLSLKFKTTMSECCLSSKVCPTLKHQYTTRSHCLRKTMASHL